MSRSNPTDNAVNPAVRYFEWNSEHGAVRYYDKIANTNVDVGDTFTFILLDQLSTVRGWSDEMGSGIYANEVRDTTQEAMVVKAFKSGTLVEGIYRDIKDRVKSLGGRFVASLYIAFKDGNDLKIAALQFKGAALGAWMTFAKDRRAVLYTKAIQIKGSQEEKKGRITFHTPIFSVTDVAAETDRAAVALDKELQAYFKSYFARTKRDAATAPQEPHGADEYPDPDSFEPMPEELTADDIQWG
jgi:hypothetical protein